MEIYGVGSDYLNEVGIDNIDLKNGNNILKTNIDIEPYAGYYHDSIPIDKIEEFYKVLGFTKTTVVLFKYKEIFGFNDGSADQY